MSRLQDIDEEMGFVFANKSDEDFEMCLAEIEDEEIIQKLHDLFQELEMACQLLGS